MQCSFYHDIFFQAVLVKRLLWVPVEPMHRNNLRDYKSCKGHRKERRIRFLEECFAEIGSSQVLAYPEV